MVVNLWAHQCWTAGWWGIAKDCTHGKFPGHLLALQGPEAFATLPWCYGPTFDEASVKLPVTHALDGAVERGEGQTAPIEGCRFARRRFTNETYQRIARHDALLLL